MMWDLLAETKKLVRARKQKARRKQTKPLSEILKRAQARGLAKGVYELYGHTIHVDDKGKARVECPGCGKLLDSYMDYVRHQKLCTSSDVG